MRSLRSWLLAATSLLSTPAFADDPAKPSPTPMTYLGNAGIWLPIESARKLLQRDQDFDYLSERNSQLTRILDFRKTEVATLNELLTSERQIVLDHATKLTLAEARISVIESRENLWYRNPYLWFVGGLIVGGSAIVAVTR